MDGVQQRYLKAIHAKVCRSCSKFMPQRDCGLAGRACPVEQNIREIVQIAPYVRGPAERSYAQELRDSVCAACGSNKGPCGVSELIDCPLDRYLATVFQAIDEVQEEIRSEEEAVLH